MNLTFDLTPAEAERAVYEYLVRRGLPARLKVKEVKPPSSGFPGGGLWAAAALEPCAQCENTTTIEGIGNRTMDCACAGGTDASA